MGFKVKKRTATITFESGTDYDGAVLKCLFDIPLKKLFDLQRLAESEQVEESFQKFGDDILIEWNIVDDNDVPVPATGEGLLSQPPEFANMILTKWLTAMKEPAVPFVSPPSDGKASAESQPE